MKINFPEKEGFYALEMPQVYSAYELYINDKLYLKVGDTHNYKAQIQNRCTFFNASGETYITIAVKDASALEQELRHRRHSVNRIQLISPEHLNF